MNEASGLSVNVLAILPSWEDQNSLSKIFWHSTWNLHHAEVLGHARLLVDEIGAGVVICDCTLADGRWQDLLRELQRRPVAPSLIVASRQADDALWAEVLNLGGFDVLATPFQAQEVIRSVSLAWRHWRDKLAIGERPAGGRMTARPGGR